MIVKLKKGVSLNFQIVLSVWRLEEPVDSCEINVTDGVVRESVSSQEYCRVNEMKRTI